MTLPDERTRAVQRTARFLLALCHRQLWEEAYPDIPWPRIPVRVRQMAGSLLKHYPADYHLKKAAEKVPDHFGKPSEGQRRG